MAETFEIEIATPERSVVKETAVRAQIPAKDGYVGILPDHAPLLSQLGIGTLTYATEQGTSYCVAIHGGYLEVLENHVRVLADAAEPGKEIDVERAKRALERAQQSMDAPGANASDGSDPSYALSAVLRAETRLDAARKAQTGEE